MNTTDFFNLLKKAIPATNPTLIIEKKYNTRLNHDLQCLLALCKEATFWDGNRFCKLLSLSEITQASENLHVDFISKKIIPFFDCGENDFIIYLSDEDRWAMFNIIDEVTWKMTRNLSDLLP